MRIIVKKQDAQKCAGYFDNENCLFATALKRYFPKAEVKDNGVNCSIDFVRYNYSKKDSAKIHNAYKNDAEDGWKLEKINKKTKFPFIVNVIGLSVFCK